MTAMEFYGLSRAQQTRLLDSFSARYAPVPLLYVPRKPAAIYGWGLLSAAAAAALFFLSRLGYGNARSALSVQSVPLAVVYALLGFALALGLLQVASIRTRTQQLPWRPGIYVFPAEVIDARASRLNVHPFAKLAAVGGASSTVTLSFSDGVSFRFPLGNANACEQAKRAIEAARERLKQDLDPNALFELDPLQPPSVASPLGPQSPMKRGAPIWDTLRWPLAVLLGVVGGITLWLARNATSDDAMYVRVQAEGQPAGFRAYLQHGRKHREPVETLLLPRAELSVARRDGSVEAVDAFIRAHPKTAISAEVDAARRTALVAAFEKARADGTLGALHEFATRYPDHPLGAELDQARHALFAKALDAYKQQAPPDQPSVVAFVEQLLDFAEHAGPKQTPSGLRGTTVELRYQRLPSDTIGRSDMAVARDPMFNGSVSLPSRYLDPAHRKPHENALLDKIAERFRRAFPPEMLVPEPGAPVDLPDGQLPDVKVPTLVITYHIEWSGGAAETKRPRGIFVGLLYMFKSNFMLPGKSEPLKHRFNSYENPPMDKVVENASLGPGPLEEATYEIMSTDAFDQYADKFLERFFVDKK